MIDFGIITLFPEMFGALESGITGQAIAHELIRIKTWNPRAYTHNKHRTVDDRPYGGGPGMVMQAQPLCDAIHTAKADFPQAKIIYVSPTGKSFTQQVAKEFSTKSSMIFVAGRYEGIDERLLLTEIDEEWSIGDYVLTGGELPIMVMIDAITRLLPGALGDADSADQDSFAHGLLDHPHYTRPEIWANLKAPEVLLGGDHKAICEWRLKQSLGQTWLKRPDLLKNRQLSAIEQKLLKKFINECQKT
ncbi:MAG: tRNA (guanosine(37)-N1)-methyltransferase TrmD [Gammaproteobacteria bacterium RIFCSPHIGHO2_02_FULL_42_13]|nr:MAG: tRNA (guanosine(37)-N1)-methyltransferase TrmD [Gammaproteobacteria bacterium RIFCSPHIGHO2_02_FULL_42_13]OGT69713.1 MAG: tRNA (guanosine(37)-N1)-methyltransferase TrmD [Gammaproteobacteria bacterium RIFCSPLOWO2_02_FULL_42_9]